MSKIQIWRYRGLSQGRRANHTAASFQHCLHGGGFDGCFGACRTHPGRSCWFECLLLCVMTFELLHKIFLQNYHEVSFILSFFLFFIPTRATFNGNWCAVAPCGCVWKGWTACMRMSCESGNGAGKMKSVSQSSDQSLFKRTQINHLDIPIKLLNQSHEEYYYSLWKEFHINSSVLLWRRWEK